MLQFIENEILLIYNLNYNKNIKNNSIIIKNINAIDDVMIIHGGNSSPINWLNLGMEFYTNKYNIYLYSIPGFSSPIDSNILKLNNDLLIEFYNENIKNFIIENNIKPNIIGHSFGGFLAINFALKYPHLIKTLIPINTVGIIHIQNNNIIMCNLICNNILYIIKKLHILFAAISFIFLKFLNKNNKFYYLKILKNIYYILNISRLDNNSIEIIYKFLNIKSITHIEWNKILFIDMITKSLPPISFIWSKKDKILSYYIPLLFRYLLKKNKFKYPKVFLLANAKHGFNITDTKLLYNNIINAINNTKKIERLIY
jgi:pimeloyl-ACP methyl ester carboxylesterase